MNSNYFYSNTVLSSRNKRFLEEVQTIAESIKQQVYVLSGPLIDSKYQYNDDLLVLSAISTDIRKKSDVQESGKID